MRRAFRPAVSTACCVASASRCSTGRYTIATFAPSRAYMTATARPMPESPAGDQRDLVLQLAGRLVLGRPVPRSGLELRFETGLLLVLLRKGGRGFLDDRGHRTPDGERRISGGAEIRARGTIDNPPVGVEAGSMTRAIPGGGCLVPAHDAPEVRANGRAAVQLAGFIAEDRDLAGAFAHHGPGVRRDFVGRRDLAGRQVRGVLRGDVPGVVEEGRRGASAAGR